LGIFLLSNFKMISSIKNNDGCIVAYIEWYSLNPALLHDDHGNYLWVQDIWIHEKLRGKNIIRNLIDEILKSKYSNHIQFIRWRNDKHNRVSKVYTIERFLKYSGG